MTRVHSPSCRCIDQVTLSGPVMRHFSSLSFHSVQNACCDLGLFWVIDDFGNRNVHFPKTGESGADRGEQIGETEISWKSVTKFSGGLLEVAR